MFGQKSQATPSGSVKIEAKSSLFGQKSQATPSESVKIQTKSSLFDQKSQATPSGYVKIHTADADRSFLTCVCMLTRSQRRGGSGASETRSVV